MRTATLYLQLHTILVYYISFIERTYQSFILQSHILILLKYSLQLFLLFFLVGSLEFYV